jgi:hypothetical protein
MKMLLGDFNAKVGRENIFKPTNGNENLYEISNDNTIMCGIPEDRKLHDHCYDMLELIMFLCKVQGKVKNIFPFNF